MKKIFTAALVMLLAMGALSAQNNFRGIVKYEIASSGKEFVQIPDDYKIVEIKVYDGKVLIPQIIMATISQDPSMGSAVQNGLKVTSTHDFSMYIVGLKGQYGIELESYTGDGKFIVKDETPKESLDSLYIVDKEPGHFYYEMTSETKDIQGFTATKQIMHRYDAEENDNPAECWTTDKIGPEYALVFGGMKGFPLVFTQQLPEGRALTFTAVEVVKGKVKEAEFFPPAGYSDNKEELELFIQELQDAMSLIEE